MKELTDKEFEAIKSLNAEYRQAMFKKAVEENEGLYILVDADGPIVLEDTEGDEDDVKYSVIPVWSHERLANAYAQGSGQEKAEAVFVTKKAWDESWVPALKEQGNVLIGFMPIGDQEFSVDDPDSF
ncbi:MAG: DUF2750 domain-containing protein [Succinivibrio sp.]